MNSGHTVALSSRGLVGDAKARALAMGPVQQTCAPVWQANSVIQPAFMTKQPMMAPTTMQAQPQQQHQTMRPTPPLIHNATAAIAAMGDECQWHDNALSKW